MKLNSSPKLSKDFQFSITSSFGFPDSHGDLVPELPLAAKSALAKVLGENRGKILRRLGNPIDETHKYVVAVRLLHRLWHSRLHTSPHDSDQVTSNHFRLTDFDSGMMWHDIGKYFTTRIDVTRFQ